MVDYWKIDSALMDRLCASSKLDLSEAEKQKFTDDLNDILKVFKIIDQVDTSHVEPAYHSIEVANVWRDDIAAQTHWKPLQNARGTEQNYIRGPKLI